eukprot:gene9564-10383_t
MSLPVRLDATPATSYSDGGLTNVNLNQTYFNHTKSTDNQICRSILQAVEQDCQIRGFYCPNVTQNYEIDGFVSVHDPQFGSDPLPLISTNINCTHQLFRSFCPKGYFCPNSKVKIRCPMGSYCGLGFDQPRSCEWLLLSCPEPGMDSPLWYILLLCFAGVLWATLMLYNSYLKRDYKARDIYSDRFAREQRKTRTLSTETLFPTLKFQFDRIEDPLTIYFDHLTLLVPNNPDQQHIDRARSLDETQQPRASLLTSIESFKPTNLLPNHPTISLPTGEDKIDIPQITSQRSPDRSDRIEGRDRERRILDDVFGVIKPYEITCILGPTGAGKTSLLNLLRGQVFHGECSGKVMVNGRELSSLHQLAHQVAFVPQNDVLYTELTVDDNIMFAAMLFNKRGWTRSEEVLPMVYKAEQILGIDHVRFQVNLRDHLMRFGYECPLNANIADYVMDCLAGYPNYYQAVEDVADIRRRGKALSDQLCGVWSSSMHPLHETEMSSVVGREGAVKERGSEAGTRRKSYLNIAMICFSRQRKLYYRTYPVITATCLILFFAGIAVGKLEGTVRVENITRAAGAIIAQTSFSQLVFSIFTSNIALQLFANDEAMRQREEAAGLPLLPLFVGKVAASSVEWLFFAFAFLSGYYSVIRSNTSFLDYLTIYVLLHLSISAMSNMMAIVMPRRIKNLGTLGLVVLLWLFGGIQPTNDKIPSVFPVLGPIINDLSPFRWSFELQAVQETSHYAEIFSPLIKRVLRTRSYVIENLRRDRCMLLLYWFAYNVAAVLLLLAKRDNWKRVRSFFCNDASSYQRKTSFVEEEFHDSELPQRRRDDYIEIT